MLFYLTNNHPMMWIVVNDIHLSPYSSICIPFMYNRILIRRDWNGLNMYETDVCISQNVNRNVVVSMLCMCFLMQVDANQDITYKDTLKHWQKCRCFFVRSCWANPNGWKSWVQLCRGKHIAKSKGVHSDVDLKTNYILSRKISGFV